MIIDMVRTNQLVLALEYTKSFISFQRDTEKDEVENTDLKSWLTFFLELKEKLRFFLSMDPIVLHGLYLASGSKLHRRLQTPHPWGFGVVVVVVVVV
ncbi:hypothetical protein BpHYR1_037743 [Brachionus plicatilis]|uniref:Uncharacterized protein n=1 Tax=Brachionus plicatilis TaxID=10195 RepID=A0A3M7RDD4_BRAPC|nr:hypothetical protein BpHYR1_037743 [Brachionus plicatilis]